MAAPISQTRERLPECGISKPELRILASRFSALQNKARKKGVQFPWTKFSQYLEVVLEKAPAGYVPSEFRIKHGPEGYDFRPEVLEIRRKGGSVDPARAVEAELAVKLLTEEGDLDQLAWEAEIAAGQ
jgi:hypothetical protein